MSTLFKSLAAVALTMTVVSPAFATTLPFTASTTMASIGNGFTIEKIGDGNATDLNGFATNQIKGSITFDFGRCVKIGEIAVWNDINPSPNSATGAIDGGIKTFELEYVDHQGKVVATSKVTPMDQTPRGTNLGVAEAYTWNDLGLQPVVAYSVRLWVHSAYWRPEVREVRFMGQPVKCPPITLNNGTKDPAKSD